ncbi:MAG TPA: DUF2721 domain-containing protein, partial [Methylomirabilota bacterium]|nr:DUF2721 domain-containing protein [Methylomirabilota bacterium]
MVPVVTKPDGPKTCARHPAPARASGLHRRKEPGRMQLRSVDLSLMTAMITPAVLISACGMLILSTSARLARILERARRLNELTDAGSA